MDTIPLDGTWSALPQSLDCSGEEGLLEALRSKEVWLSVRVPGEIHMALIQAGQMPEPTASLNMPECRWPETRSWWHRRMFDLDEAFLRHERQELIFDGLDLYAQVFVNGKLAGESANAFVPVAVDARGLLQAGTNELVVRLTAGSELAKDETPAGQEVPFRPNSAAHGEIPNPIQGNDYYGHRGWAGRKWLRKPQFEYGWDWVDALPNIGIWRSVRLEGRTHAALNDLRLDTMRRDGKVFLEMEAVVENLHPWSERECELVLEIQPPASGQLIRRVYPVSAPPGKYYLQDTFEVLEPKLWWPNGLGEQPGDQPLYEVKANLYAPDRSLCDRRAFEIGLRTIELDRSPLPEGSRFCIRVNGEDVFCRGVNIGPHDPILARITDAKNEALIAEARNANVNMIRINGCWIYESPAFFRA